MCSYAELQKSSISRLSQSFVKEFAFSLYRWSYAQLYVLTMDKSTKLWEPWQILEIELELIGVGLVKSLNQGLLPISLNLISNGIKEILTPQKIPI